MTGAQEPEDVYTKQQRIARLAEQHPDRAFTSLAHYLDVRWLKVAYLKTRKDGAVGVDGQTADAYAADLDANLRRLLERVKTGRYKAPPVRRVHIPKGDGKSTRPIGIPAFEDKVLQRAVVMILEPIYERSFLGCSYGFRPNRSAHQALSKLRNQLMGMGGGWVIDLDIRAYFDTIDRVQLREFVQRRVKDGVLNRLLGKWLSAGVVEDGQLSKSESGTPQGGVVSPLLANIYLHYVLDCWFEQEVKPRMTGRCCLIRFADDAVLSFSSERDARRVMEILPKRFARFGLELHPNKTRLLHFRPTKTGSKSATFDFLGFTHFWGKARSGNWIVMQKTACDRFRRALKRIAVWCRFNRHLPLREQHLQLSRKLRGHYAYYGIRGNAKALQTFRFRVERLWVKWLGRRSQRAHIPWEKAGMLLKLLFLPPARIVHR